MVGQGVKEHQLTKFDGGHLTFHKHNTEVSKCSLGLGFTHLKAQGKYYFDIRRHNVWEVESCYAYSLRVKTISIINV
jgi:hypothetical protein